MATESQNKPTYRRDDDSAWISVQNPAYVDLDETLVLKPALKSYVEVKLHAIAPWLADSSSYQSAFEAAYQLCQSGYDFNLIIYEQPLWHDIACYEPRVSAFATYRHWYTKPRGWKQYWQQLFQPGQRRTSRPKYHNEIVMVPGKRKWVEVGPGRLIVVPEGILRYDQSRFAD